MAVKYCTLCDRLVDAKRRFGVGTLLLVVLTGGFWLLLMPFYSQRCKLCGTTKVLNSKPDANTPSSNTSRSRDVALTLLILVAVVATIPLMMQPSSTDKSTADSEESHQASTSDPSASTDRAKVVTVREAQYGDEWPFPNHNTALLTCLYAVSDGGISQGTRQPHVIVRLNGQWYGLNGTAMSGSYPDARGQMAKHPEWGTYILGASQQLIDRGLALCRNAG